MKRQSLFLSIPPADRGADNEKLSRFIISPAKGGQPAFYALSLALSLLSKLFSSSLIFLPAPFSYPHCFLHDPVPFICFPIAASQPASVGRSVGLLYTLSFLSSDS